MPVYNFLWSKNKIAWIFSLIIEFIELYDNSYYFQKLTMTEPCFKITTNFPDIRISIIR